MRVPSPPANVILLIAFVSVACGDSTGVGDRLVVEISADAQPTPFITEAPEGPRIECHVNLTARASGSGTATWGDARFLWYIGANRASPSDSSSVHDTEVAYAWGGETLTSGETRQAGWRFGAGAPFEVLLSFNYTASEGGPLSTATTRVPCGPPPQVGPSPVVSQLESLTPDGELQVGDTISFTYTASSAGGLWATSLAVSGAFAHQQIFVERFATNVTRTVKIAVPTGSTPSVPVSVVVGAFDAAMQSGSRTLTTQLTFVDRTPPVLLKVAMHHGLGRPLGMGISGQYAPGDLMTLYVDASDDNALGFVVYELGAPANFRDSVAAPARHASHSWVFNVQVRSEWVGSPVLAIHVRDAAGLTSATAQSAPDSLRFYPVIDRPVTVASLGNLAEVEDIAYDRKRDLLYLANPRENRILVLSPSSMTLQPSIELAARPAGIDLSVSGDSLLVAIPSSRSIAVFDLTKQPSVPSAITMPLLDTAGTIHSAVTPAPDGLRVAANGKAIVLLSHPTRSGDQVVDVDLGSGAQLIRADARSPSLPDYLRRGMDPNPDRSSVYLLGLHCLRRYDASSDTFTACQPGVTTNSFGLSFSAAGSRLTFGDHLLDRDMGVIWSMNIFVEGTAHTALTPDGDTVFLANATNLTKARASDRLRLERIRLPLSAERLFMAPSGEWILVLQNSHGARVARVGLR